MLDLNISIVHGENEIIMAEKYSDGTGGEQMVESGTSNSSILNAEGSSNAGDDDSSSTLKFDIVNARNRTKEVSEEQITRTEFVTQQLFPMTGDRLVNQGHSSASSTSLLRPNWIELSFGQANGWSPEMNFLQQQPPPPPPPQQPPVKKSRRGPRSRSSQYRGVTFYRRTGRWESHIWDCGKQVYLGGFDTAHAAARAYDRAALKFRGVDADINFNISDYEEDMKQLELKNLTKEEFVHILRRQSTGFSRGSSKYRGVTLHKCGRWEARMGQFLGKKAYDKAAIRCNGREAVTNFEASAYEGEMRSESQNGDSEHNLDLNLGISTSSSRISSKEIGSLRPLQFHSYDMHDARRLKMENPDTTVHNPPLKGLPVTSSNSWTGLYPNFFSNYEERGMEKSKKVVPQVAPNWGTWQMGILSSATNTNTNAASSGFSSSPLKGPHHPPNPTAHNHHLYYSSNSTPATNNSQYFYHIRPPPP